MENFKRVLKKRFYRMIALNFLAVAFIALSGLYNQNITIGMEDITNMIHGFQIGIFIGIQIMMVIKIVKYNRGLKDEDYLKALYIEENDERKKLIQDKIGGVGFNLILGVIAIATVIAGFFSGIIFITLCSVLIFIALIKGILKIYYKNKI